MSDEMGRKCDELKCDDDRWRVGEHYAGSRGRSRTWTALVRDVQQIWEVVSTLSRTAEGGGGARRHIHV